MHITKRDGREHFFIISTRYKGPDANRLTAFNKPDPSVESFEVFISKNLARTRSSWTRLLISLTSKREQQKQNSLLSLNRSSISSRVEWLNAFKKFLV